MIRVRHLSKAFDGIAVFDDFSCDIPRGVVTCIMAPSGKGKTTLLRMLMGFEQPDSGAITGLEGLRRSAVFQEDRLCGNLSACRNINLVRDVPVPEEELAAAFAAVALPEHTLFQPVWELSGGQQRRIAILRALFAAYDVLFMDEPFKGLDTDTRSKVVDYVRRSCAGRTVILITHDSTDCTQLGGNLLTLD